MVGEFLEHVSFQRRKNLLVDCIFQPSHSAFISRLKNSLVCWLKLLLMTVHSSQSRVAELRIY
jgi:hypothetical protein